MKFVTEGFMVLFAVLLLSYFAQNKTVVYAVLIVLALKILRLDKPLHLLETHGLRWSIIFLTAAILAPFGFDKIPIRDIFQQVREPLGIVAIIIGAVATYLARQGVVMMDETPNIVPALVGGTIIGISLFRGVPVGPLVSSGIVAMIYAIYNFFK